MRILWITSFGKWIAPLLSLISEDNSVAVIYPTDVTETFDDYGATIHKIKFTDSEMTENMSETVFEKYNSVIKNFRPDIIHVHGTEKNSAQIQNYIHHIPIVVSIQGVSAGYIPFSNAYLTNSDMLPYKTFKNVLGKGGYLQMRHRFIKAKHNYEMDILSKSRYFFCRTNWDRAWVMFSNSEAKVYQGEELLRQPFYDNAGKWKYAECKRNTVFMTAGYNPIKGFHIALKSIALIKQYVPDVKLVVPGLPQRIYSYEGLKSRLIGEEYVNFCKNLIMANHLETNVILLDYLEPYQMVEELKKANVFLSPTTIDNSPNSIGEAMMIGLPVVCSPVGGVSSFMKDEYNCLIAPAGDEYITAYQIKRLFDNPELAVQLGNAAHSTALLRHDRKITVDQYMNAYKEVVNDFTTCKLNIG